MIKKLTPVILSLMILIPAITANASTATVTAVPSLNMSKVVINDSVNATFSYPSTSYVSHELNGVSYSLQISDINVQPGSDAFEGFERALKAQDPSLSLINMSVSISRALTANSTELVMNRDVTITAWVSGMFNGTGNKVVGNFAWKGFDVKEEMDVDEQGINFVNGQFFMFGPLSSKALFLSLLGSVPFNQASTLNFSAFNTPLSQWTRTYNPSDNITSFSKSTQSTTLFSSSLSINGQNYSLKVVSDPAFTLNVPGYAEASGNSIIITRPPSSPIPYIAAAAVVVVIVAIVVVYLKKR